MVKTLFNIIVKHILRFLMGKSYCGLVSTLVNNDALYLLSSLKSLSIYIYHTYIIKKNIL